MSLFDGGTQGDAICSLPTVYTVINY